MTIEIEMSNEEYEVAKLYAKQKGMSLQETIKQVFFETIEDEFDIKQAEIVLKEYEKTGISYSHEEMKKKLGIVE